MLDEVNFRRCRRLIIAFVKSVFINALIDHLILLSWQNLQFFNWRFFDVLQFRQGNFLFAIKALFKPLISLDWPRPVSFGVDVASIFILLVRALNENILRPFLWNYRSIFRRTLISIEVIFVNYRHRRWYFLVSGPLS